MVIAGIAIHPWGRWSRGFCDYGVDAARAALSDAGIHWRDVQFISAPATMRQGYAGQVSAITYAQKLGFQGADAVTTYGACTSGAQALAVARASILAEQCDVALVVGADVETAGMLSAPAGDSHPNDPDAMRYGMGFTNPVYLALAARRRMHECGTSEDDLAAVKVKNARHGLLNTNARYRYALTPEQVRRSPMLYDPLRRLHLSATSDGGAALVLMSKRRAKQRGVSCVYLSAVSTATPIFPNGDMDMGRLATESTVAANGTQQLSTIVTAVYERAALGAEDISLAEVYDLSPVTELEWYEHLGLCRKGEAELLLKSGATTLGGRVPVNCSGGLTSFGEAPAAQVLAQVYELVLQLRGSAGSRQTQEPRVGIATSQGVFGHAAALVVKR